MAKQNGGSNASVFIWAAAGSRASAKMSNQISLMLPVQSRQKKYSASKSKQINNTCAPSCPARGALAIVTDVGQDAMDADALRTNSA